MRFSAIILHSGSVARPEGETGRFRKAVKEHAGRIAQRTRTAIMHAGFIGSLSMDSLNPRRIVQRDLLASVADGGLDVPAITRKNVAEKSGKRTSMIFLPSQENLRASSITNLAVPAIDRKMAVMNGDICASGLGEVEREIIVDVPAIERRNVPKELLQPLNSNGRKWRQVFTLSQKLSDVKQRIAKFPEASVFYRQGIPKDPHIVNVQGRSEMLLTTPQLKRLADILELEARLARFPQIKLLSGPISPLERDGSHLVRAGKTKMILTTTLLGRLVEEFEIQAYRNWAEMQDKKEAGWKKNGQ